MTGHIHDPATHPVGRREAATAIGQTVPPRPRWLVPGLAIGVVAIGLVAIGVVSLSTVLYAGMFGGMVLMHTHGHGRHVAHGSVADRDRDLSRPSGGSQPPSARSSSGLDDRASSDAKRSETQDHDQRDTHTCH